MYIVNYIVNYLTRIYFEMAHFRRIVNEMNRIEESEFSEYPESQSQSLLTPQYYNRTSTPSSSQVPSPRFQFHAQFATSFIRTPIRQQRPVTPSFFEQYGNQSQGLQPRISPQIQPRQPPFVQENQGSQRSRNKWSAQQTNVLVNAWKWKDAFVQLESHKNPKVWKAILFKVNEAGEKRTVDQIKKRINYLKDKYKEAKAKNLKSGGARNTTMYYDKFDEVLGTRSLVQLGEVREAGNCEEPGNLEDEQAVSDEKERDGSNEQMPEPAAVENAQPRRKKKKKPTKLTATTQLVGCMQQMQQKQDETVCKILQGMEKIKESSRRHTSEVLLQVAEMFLKDKRKRQSREDSSESD